MLVNCNGYLVAKTTVSYLWNKPAIHYEGELID